MHFCGVECIPIDFHGLQIWENFLQSPVRYFQMVKAQKRGTFPKLLSLFQKCG